MGYMTDGLTFNTLRQANVHRHPVLRDRAKKDETA